LKSKNTITIRTIAQCTVNKHDVSNRRKLQAFESYVQIRFTEQGTS